MPEDNDKRRNIFSANDPLDINELASLNDDISPEFIEQLQNQVAQNASEFTGKPIISENNDAELFEEVNQEEPKKAVKLDENIDDNFIKKYKAKLNKQKEAILEKDEETEIKENSAPQNKQTTEPPKEINKEQSVIESNPSTAVPDAEIENLTSGNIIEKPAVQEQIDYNDSLDFLDGNVKYSKYVVYIDPENTEFIESLTVKERKNLINRILREQDDIAITKRRLGLIQTIIKHTVIAIITLSVSIPVVYWTVNASLEASINNYRRSETIFKTLYKEKGKIKSPLQH